jgi:flavin-binding protein dodecin
MRGVTPVTKTLWLSGGSQRSIEDAISTVLARAATSVEDIASFEVVQVRGTVDDAGVPSSYDVTLDIVFNVRDIP